MKKIKLVLSDLHLGNGRYLPDGTVNPLEDFVNDQRFIEFVQHYGEQNQDADVELIFDTLKAFNTCPRRRIVFILGNHDPGLLWKGVQEVIRSVIQGEVVFVPEAYRFDGVHIEHGNRLEPIFRFDNKRYFLTKGYPEPILNLPWGVFFVKDFIFRIKRTRPYIDKVKPYNRYMRWATFNDFWFGFWNMLRWIGFIFKTRFSRLPLKRAGAFKGFRAFWDITRSPNMVEEAQAILDQGGCRIVILGHTHIPLHNNFGK